MSRKSDSNDHGRQGRSSGVYGTQVPQPFGESSPPAEGAGAEEVPSSGTKPAPFGTVQAPPPVLPTGEGGASAREGFATIQAPPPVVPPNTPPGAASTLTPPAMHEAVHKSYGHAGDQGGALQEAMKTCQLSKPPGGQAPAVGAPGQTARVERPKAGKSSWNLRIHQRDVTGQLSGIIHDLVGDDESAAKGLRSAMSGGEEAPEYEVLERIAAGNMGVVYRALQTSLNREIVIKTLKPETQSPEHDQALFVSEAVVTANLVHPNIVPIHDLGRTADGKLFYSMKHVTGMPWSATLKARSLEENLEIFIKVCDAVAYAHSRGVINRDLKPENVVIGEFGEVSVLDWGLAITTDEFEKQDSVVVEFRGAAGSPVYMAPEMLEEDVRGIGKHSDIYLLGAILFEILEGYPPHLIKATWGIESPDEQLRMVFQAVMENQIEQDTVNNGELMQIARRALATEPGDRYSSVERLQDAIREYRITGRAEELARSIEQNRPTDYDEYQSAVALFSDAVRRWPDNRRAVDGNQKSRVAYAQLALKKGDYDLGLHVVADSAEPAFRPIRKKLRKARAKRRLIRVTWVMMFLAAMGLTAVTIFQDARLTRLDVAVAEAEDRERIAEKNADAAKERAQQREAEAEQKVLDATRLANERIAAADARVAAADEEVEAANKLVAAADRKRDAALKAEQEAKQRAETAENAAKTADKLKTDALQLAEAAKADAQQAREDAEIAQGQVQMAREARHEALLESHVNRIETSFDLGLYDEVIEQVETALTELESAQNPKFTESVRQWLRKKQKTARGRKGNASLKLDRAPTHAAFSRDGTTVAAVVGRTQPVLSVWHRNNTDAGVREFQSTPLSDVQHVYNVSVSRDGSIVCAVGQDVHLWRRHEDGYQQVAVQRPANAGSSSKCLISEGMDHLYVLGNDAVGTVEIYQIGDDTARLLMHAPLWVAGRHAHGISDAVLLPDESFLIVDPNSHYYTTAFPIAWDGGTPEFAAVSISAPTLKGLNNLDGQNERFQVESLALSQDGQRLALISFESEVLVLPRATDAEPDQFPFASPGQPGQHNRFQSAFSIRELVFTADGNRIATLHPNRYIQLWDEGETGFVASKEDALYPLRIQPGSLLRGHSDEVLAVSFAGSSPDRLLSVSADRTLRGWDLQTYGEFTEELRELRDAMVTTFGPEEPGQPAAMRTPQSSEPGPALPQRLLTRRYLTTGMPAVAEEAEPGQEEGLPTTRISRTAFVTPIPITQGRNVFSAQFSKDGDRLLVGADDLAAHVFQSQSGGRTMTMSGRMELFFQPDRNNFLEGHVSEIAAIRFLPPRGEFLLTSDYFGSISIWDAAPGDDGIGYEKSRLLTEYSFSEFAVSDDGQWIVAGGAYTDSAEELDEARLKHLGLIWQVEDIRDAVTAAPTLRLEGQHPNFAITAVGISPDSSLVVTAGRRGRIVVWDRASGAVLTSVDAAHNGDGVSGLFFATNDTLITAGFDGRVLRWQYSNQALSEPETLVSGQFIVRLRPSADRTRFAASDIQPPPGNAGEAYKAQLAVDIWTIEGQKERELHRRLIPTQDPELAVRHDVSWATDDAQLLFTLDGVLTLYDTADWSIAKKFQLAQSDLRAVRGALAPAGRNGQVSAATFDGRFAHLWDLTDGSHIAEFRTHGYRTTASFSFDRRFVVTGSETIRVFESDEDAANHGQTLLRMKTGEAHRRPVADVAFSPGNDDYRIASIDLAGEIRVWSWSPTAPATATLGFELPPQNVPGTPWSEGMEFGNVVTWKPDASMLAAVQNGGVRLWRLGDQGPERVELPLPEARECRFNSVDFSLTQPIMVASGVAFSTDRGRLISIALVWRLTDDGATRLIGVAEGEHSTVTRSRGMQTGITSAAFDDAAEELLTGGADGQLIRWQLGYVDAESPEELIQISDVVLPGDIRPHSRAITGLDTAKDGRTVSSDEQGRIFIWPTISD